MGGGGGGAGCTSFRVHGWVFTMFSWLQMGVYEKSGNSEIDPQRVGFSHNGDTNN